MFSLESKEEFFTCLIAVQKFYYLSIIWKSLSFVISSKMSKISSLSIPESVKLKMYSTPSLIIMSSSKFVIDCEILRAYR